MKNHSAQEMFEELTRGLPHFDDGRINFTGVRKAPVLNAVVYCRGEILLVKRSDKVSAYRGLWNGISGFIDEPKSIEDFAKHELREELGFAEGAFTRIEVCEPYEVDDRSIDRVWVVYPVLIVLNQKPVVTLDWEHTDYAWIDPASLGDYEYVKDFDISVNKALGQISK
jgi:8-oxo-dGTP pyrophosphatase MutT (NUDIX family)